MPIERADLEERLEPIFRENFSRFGELGAAVSVWQSGRPIVELRGGFRDAHRERPWDSDTLVLIWSATKGLGSACLLHALQENNIGIERPVAEFWPEFGQNKKERISLGQLLSHQAGLTAIDEPVDILDYAAVVAALEKQAPLWPPGQGHGYHARTFGFLIDELVRRIAHQTIGEYLEARFCRATSVSIFGLACPRKKTRALPQFTRRGSGRTPEPAAFYHDLTKPGSLVRRTFTSPQGLHSVSGMNRPEVRSESIVSFGGIGSATSLAKFYAMLANGGEWDGRRFFEERTLGWMSETLSDGIDRIFQIPTAFSAGFMKDSRQSRRRVFGPSPLSFGHPGAGGSHAFADPANKLGFAYVMNQMKQAVLPNEKSLRLVDAIYQ